MISFSERERRISLDIDTLRGNVRTYDCAAAAAAPTSVAKYRTGLVREQKSELHLFLYFVFTRRPCRRVGINLCVPSARNYFRDIDSQLQLRLASKLIQPFAGPLDRQSDSGEIYIITKQEAISIYLG